MHRTCFRRWIVEAANAVEDAVEDAIHLTQGSKRSQSTGGLLPFTVLNFVPVSI